MAKLLTLAKKLDMGSTSKDSVNGLKFGQRIYFEDVGIGAPAKSGGGSSSSSPAPEKKGGGPRCQVEGCSVDLSEAKAYYGKHKVCAVHSKTPVIIVNGIQQRFCQQCSRFHQLPEFDQGKRSCRRRLAGHNERRRKPTPRPPQFSSPYGRLPSSVFGKGGGFLMNFSMYPKLTGRQTAIKAPNHSTPMGKSPPNMWHNDSGNASSTHFLQSFSSGTHYPTGPTIPSGECFTGASNSGCALSLLSNQPWGSRDVSFGPFVSNQGAQMGQPTKPTGFLTNQFSDVPRGFKGLEDVSKSKEMQPHLGLSQIAQPSDEIGPSQHRQYVELENSRAFDSSIQYINWSL